MSRFTVIILSILFAAVFALGQLSDFDLREANTLVRLSGASYCVLYPSRGGLVDWTCKACKDSGIELTEITTVRDTPTFGNGYVGYTRDFLGQGERIVVAFLGSVSVENWMTNFDFTLVGYEGCPECLVHEGFLKAYKALHPQVLAGIAKINKPNVPIVVTGQSLGAALSVHAIAALSSTDAISRVELAGSTMYTTNNPNYDALSVDAVKVLGGTTSGLVQLNVTEVHQNFGQPRVGNAAFAKLMANSVHVYRHINGQDPVPHVPPVEFGYQHPAQEVWWNNGTSVSCSPINGEDMTCSSGQANLNPFDHLVYLGFQIKQTPDEC